MYLSVAVASFLGPAATVPCVIRPHPPVRAVHIVTILRETSGVSPNGAAGINAIAVFLLPLLPAYLSVAVASFLGPAATVPCVIRPHLPVRAVQAVRIVTILRETSGVSPNGVVGINVTAVLRPPVPRDGSARTRVTGVTRGLIVPGVR